MENSKLNVIGQRKFISWLLHRQKNYVMHCHRSRSRTRPSRPILLRSKCY